MQRGSGRPGHFDILWDSGLRRVHIFPHQYRAWEINLHGEHEEHGEHAQVPQSESDLSVHTDSDPRQASWGKLQTRLEHLVFLDPLLSEGLPYSCCFIKDHSSTKLSSSSASHLPGQTATPVWNKLRRTRSKVQIFHRASRSPSHLPSGCPLDHRPWESDTKWIESGVWFFVALDQQAWSVQSKSNQSSHRQSLLSNFHNTGSLFQVIFNSAANFLFGRKCLDPFRIMALKLP